ncbi:MAG: aminotransferase class I/II-fold pyridoxal phosphate-dependent enzyme [Streptosporangiales bacterium]|nr:aminotransferase class I/II-fold pyridoxal phosphate-dependent enzyme [Streptosporangiales bacterium]
MARILTVDAVEQPYYRALALGMRALILDGRVPLRVRLPAERDLARALGVSRTTVTAAYDRLREQGYIESRQGSGSWTTLPSGHGRSSSYRPPLHPDPELIDLGVAAPPAVDGLPAVVAAAAERLPAYTGRSGYETAGLEELRAAVARRYTERGVRTAPDQIFVTAGAQHALVLLLRLLLHAGDPVLVESSSYPHALEAIRMAGGRLVPAGVTGAGWDVEILVAGMREARFAYLIPDFHNPTGALMTDEGRAELVGAARRAGTYVAVDESAAELEIDTPRGGMPRPLAAHDPDGRVLSIGSLDKLVWGGLRVGWIRATPPMVRRLAATRASLDLASPFLEQLVGAQLFDDVAGIRQNRARELAERRAALCGPLRRYLPEWRFAEPAGGLVVWAELPEPVAPAVAEAAARHGVRVVPGPVFGADGTLDHHLRLSYTQPPDLLDAAVGRLAVAYREVVAGGHRSPSPAYV